MPINNKVIEKLKVNLEVDVSEYANGFHKGFVEGFKQGSQTDKTKDTELCIITKVTKERNIIDEYEFCEVINTKEKE